MVWWCGGVLLQWCDGVITWRDVVLHTDGRLVLCGEVLVHEAVQQTRLPDPVCGSTAVSVLRSVWWTCVPIVWWCVRSADEDTHGKACTCWYLEGAREEGV